jgi:hypothetical protein
MDPNHHIRYVAGLLGIAILLSSCTTRSGDDAGRLPSLAGVADPAATTQTPSPSSGQPTATGSATPRAAASSAAAQACPVSGATLLAALKEGSTDIYRRSGSPATLTDVACYHNYATGWTPIGASQSTGIVFGYDAAAGRWRPLNLGSGGFCEGYVARDIAEHLPGCGW